jgi:hypothetical protein
LKAPGTKRLKVKYDELLSISLQFWFQFELAPLQPGTLDTRGEAEAAYLRADAGAFSARADTRPLFSSI